MTDFWTQGIVKEMTNVRITIVKLDDITPYEIRKGKIKPGYEHVNVHMIFDSNMDGKFNRKAIFVADGHTTTLPSSITY